MSTESPSAISVTALIKILRSAVERNRVDLFETGVVIEVAFSLSPWRGIGIGI
jgi:hypothetical protein